MTVKTIFLDRAHLKNDKQLAGQICEILFERQINSLIVEGGPKTIQKFIDENLWDEARIFITHHELCKGKKSPSIDKKNWNEKKIGTDSLITLHND